jgi:large subunit ribosomal protein L21
MFAVVVAGGKQFKVAEGDVIAVEKMAAKVGQSVTLNDVRLLFANGATKVGNPMVAGASVSAEVVQEGRQRKVIIFKKKRRQNYRRKKGHRQPYTMLKITKIAA